MTSYNVEINAMPKIYGFVAIKRKPSKKPDFFALLKAIEQRESSSERYVALSGFFSISMAWSVASWSSPSALYVVSTCLEVAPVVAGVVVVVGVSTTDKLVFGGITIE